MTQIATDRPCASGVAGVSAVPHLDYGRLTTPGRSTLKSKITQVVSRPELSVTAMTRRRDILSGSLIGRWRARRLCQRPLRRR